MSWHYHGAIGYLLKQTVRFGLEAVWARKADAKNVEIHRAAALLGQLCQRYHTARSNGQAKVIQGDDQPAPVFHGMELAQVKGTIDSIEAEDVKLHLLAAASRSQLDQCYRAFGLEPPHRSYSVVGEYDEITRLSWGQGRRLRNSGRRRPRAGSWGRS